MFRRGNVRVVAAFVVVGLFAACSSGDDSGPAATVAASTTVASTDPAPQTTEAPTTSAASTTTTIDPDEELAAAVEADFREADRLGREASMDPFDAAKEAAALDRRLGVIAENFAAKLADWRDRNYALRENPDIPASITVEVPATLVLDGADVAEMQICEVDPWIVIEVGAGPNGSDAIVNDEVVSYRTVIFMRIDGGIWRIEGGNETGRWEGTAQCPGDG